jgi:hypothetical protein
MQFFQPLLEKDIYQFIRFILVICGTCTEGLQEYLLEKGCPGITEYKYRQIIQHLTFDPVAVITAFNDGLHNLITVGGHCAIDE